MYVLPPSEPSAGSNCSLHNLKRTPRKQQPMTGGSAPSRLWFDVLASVTDCVNCLAVSNIMVPMPLTTLEAFDRSTDELQADLVSASAARDLLFLRAETGTERRQLFSSSSQCSPSCPPAPQSRLVLPLIACFVKIMYKISLIRGCIIQVHSVDACRARVLAAWVS